MLYRHLRYPRNHLTPLLLRHQQSSSSKFVPKSIKNLRSNVYVADTLEFARRCFRYGVPSALTLHIFFSYFYVLNACDGISMLPTINSFGDWILISKYYRRGRGVEVGDIVSFYHPVDENVQSCKRLLGMEGDFVLLDSPGTNGKMIQVPQGHCWVVGDNLKHSRDSRIFGPLPLALIRGKVVARWTPWSHWQWMRNGLQDAEEEEEEEEDDDVD